MAFISSQKSFFKAAKEGDQKEVLYCLRHLPSGKFDKNARDKEGKTALYTAAAAGHENIVNTLLNRYADTSIADNEGNTPVMAAVREQKRKCLRVLLDNGANPDAHDNKYIYPLHLAAFNGDLDSVNMLLAAGAKVDARISNNSRTPLHWAVDKGQADIVTALLAAGASLEMQDSSGLLPMDIAKNKKHPHIVTMLQEAQAKREQKDEEKELPVVKTLPAAADSNAAEKADNTEGWVLTGNARVTHIGTYPEINRRLTEVFNFESRERIVIAENLKTGAESMTPPESFDALGEDMVKKAFAAYAQLGGTAVGEAQVFPRRLNKGALPPAKSS